MTIVNKSGLGIIILLLLVGIATIFLNQPTETTVDRQNMGPTHLAGDYQVQIKLNPNKLNY